jgi:hypothetical protein
MKRISLLLLTFMAALALSACVVGSYQPITPLQQATINTALLGTWLPVAAPGNKAHTGPTRTGYHLYHVGEHEDGHSYRIQDIRLDGNGYLKSDEIIGHGSVVNGQRYLNLISVDEGKQAYILVRYVVEQDGLVLYSVNDDVYKQHLQAGLITEDPKEEGIITMPSDKLYNYMAQHGSAVLSEAIGYYVRGQSLDD